jgi:putative ABC transport system permease protein
MRTAEWSQAWRSLWRRPAFAVSAILTLAFGAGVTTAVFSLVDAVLIRDLPYPDADRVVTVYESSPSAGDRTSLVAPARLEDWRRLSQSFAALSATYSENVTDTSGREPERLMGLRVAPGFFDVFAVPLGAGRYFSADEERFNGPGAAVISDAFWARRFARDGSAIGHALAIGGRLYTIVGVVPAAFTSAATDVWLPMQTPPGLLRMRDARFLNGVGRLKAGVSIDAGARELSAVQDALGREFPGTDAGWSVQLRSLKDARIGEARRGLVLVFGAVVLLWTIAVANIAGLTLVQVTRRARELALRTALGASRGRVIGALVREGLVIAVIGGAAGVAIAFWLVSVMRVTLTRTPRIDELTLDWRALLFVSATSLLAACAFAVIPALAGTRARISPLLTPGTRSAGPVRHHLQRALVVGQVALSVVLVASATLLVQSYYTMTRADTGFDAAGSYVFRVAARWDEDRTRVGQLQERLVASLEALPYVQAAGTTNFLPTTSATLRYQVRVEGLIGPNDDGSISVGARMIGGGYLQTIRALLVSGAWCPAVVPAASGPLGQSATPLVAMVNRRFVEVHAAGQDVVGRGLEIVGQGAGPRYTIAGVVGDIAEDGAAASAAPYVYTCNPAGAWPDPEYVVRTADAGPLDADIRRIVREIDPGRAVFGLRPLQDVLDASLQQPRLDAAMLLFFAAAAVGLAAIGQYSLFMLVVSERAREMAVRLAVGARPGQVMSTVMASAGRLLAGGLVVGTAVTALADRVLRGLVFGVNPTDPTALAVATLALALVSAIAVAAPAARAARVPPGDLLKSD